MDFACIAVEDRLDIGLFVDRVVHGLTHAFVLQLRQIGVQGHIAHDGGRRSDDLDVLLSVDGRSLCGRHGIDIVGFAGLQHRDARAILRHRFERDAVDGGLPVPVAGKRSDRDMVAFHALLELIGARAIRVLRQIGGALRKGLRAYDFEHRHLVDEGAVGFLQLDDDGVVVRGLDRLPFGNRAVLTQLLVFHAAVVIRFEGGRVELGSVVEFHALAELEGIGEVIRLGLPAFRERRNDLLVLIECHERLIHGGLHGHGQRVGNLMRIESRDIQVESDDKVLVRRCGLLAGSRAPRPRSGRCGRLAPAGRH